MNDIPYKKYLDDALLSAETDAERMADLVDWLPENIIDAHAHCNLAEHVLEISPEIYNHPISTFPSFSLEESYAVIAKLYPGKKVSTLRFPNAWRGIDHRAANEYLLSNTRENDRVAIYGIPTDEEYTLRMMAREGFVALKCYPAFLKPVAESIYQYFTPRILEEAEKRGIPIILHLPRLITECTDDLVNLLNDFPDLTVVLAHLGLPLIPAHGLDVAYREIAKYGQVFMDTSIVPSAEVVRIAIAEFGPDRILYGSDEPLNLIRAKAYEHPSLGQRFATEYPYHWARPKEQAIYGHLANGAVSLHWQTIEAIRTAMEGLFPTDALEDAKRKVFYGNAKRVF